MPAEGLTTALRSDAWIQEPTPVTHFPMVFLVLILETTSITITVWDIYTNSQYDFYTVALHEIIHMLGFTSYVAANGGSRATFNVFTAFDEFILDPGYNPLLVSSGSESV